MKKLILGAIVAIIAVFAQTSIKSDQLRAGATAPLRLLAIDTTGRFGYLTVGAGLEIVGSTIQVATTAAKSPAPLTRNADGTYVFSGSGAVFRNGVLQALSQDYTAAGTTLTPKTPWASDDVVMGY